MGMGYACLGGALYGCPGPKPPTPTPSPTVSPTPKQPVFTNLLLRQEAGKLLREGQPFKLFGFIPCWDGEEIDHMGWPGLTDEGMDYALSFGANAFHIRLGPTLPDNTWPNGLNYGTGPYNPDGTFSAEWWARVRHIVERAGQRGANVEVDLIDGWVCKHSQWGEFGMPWPSADVEACTNTFTPTHRAFVRKAVEELGCFGNVIWQDGNEVGVSGRYRPEWTFAIVDEVRKAEQELGCGVVHMFGTNSGQEVVEADPRIDYSSTHARTGVGGPHLGKFRQNNERNPFFAPEQEHALFCAAQGGGAAWWFWRGGMSKEAMDQTLALWQSGCEGQGGGDCPFEVPTVSWIKVKPHGTNYYDATPLVGGSAYCRSIGFPPGQSNCPVRPEGDPFRLECELQSMGGRIEWKLVNATGDIGITPRHMGYQFEVSGNGTAEVQCFVPSRGSENVCRNGQGGTLIISK